MTPAAISTRHFAAFEMACHDGTPYPVVWADILVELFTGLDVIRDACGYPIRIVSGYRTAAYNRKVGGAPHSLHVAGRAADIRPIKHGFTFVDIVKLGATIDALIAAGSLPMIGGVGKYPVHVKDDGTSEPGWIHVDTREKINGHVVRWEGRES